MHVQLQDVLNNPGDVFALVVGGYDDQFLIHAVHRRGLKVRTFSELVRGEKKERVVDSGFFEG